MQGIFGRQTQKGRTVVEMLALLAIVGILSIGGIMGYSIAVQLFREAETVDSYSVTVAGGRSWPIAEHYGSQVKPGGGAATTMLVPIREVVSRVNYSDEVSFKEAVVSGKESDVKCELEVFEDGSSAEVCNDADVYYSKREYESFDTLTYAPVFVRAESSCVWSVRIVGLSNKLCKDIVRKRTLGYDYVYRAQTDSKGLPRDPAWNDFNPETAYKNEAMANSTNIDALCQLIDPTDATRPLVQEYYDQLDDETYAEIVEFLAANKFNLNIDIFQRGGRWVVETI